MTKEEKGKEGEEYVKRIIQQAIAAVGKEIKMFGPIVLEYYSLYGRRTCEIDHVIITNNIIILGETKNGHYESIDYEAPCWNIAGSLEKTDNPIVQNHYHKEVFCAHFSIMPENVVTIEFILQYDNCKMKSAYPNDFIFTKNNLKENLVILLKGLDRESSTPLFSDIESTMERYQHAYTKIIGKHVENLKEIKYVEEKTRTQDGNYRFKRTDIARCPVCNSFLSFDIEKKLVTVRKSSQLKIRCNKCTYEVKSNNYGKEGEVIGFSNVNIISLSEYKGWGEEKEAELELDILEYEASLADPEERELLNDFMSAYSEKEDETHRMIAVKEKVKYDYLNKNSISTIPQTAKEYFKQEAAKKHTRKGRGNIR